LAQLIFLFTPLYRLNQIKNGNIIKKLIILSPIVIKYKYFTIIISRERIELKNKFGLYITIIVLISLTVLMMMPGCSNNISGSRILSDERIKGHEITTIKVTFYDSDNRLKSPIATMTSSNQDEQNYIKELRDIIATSKGISIDEDSQFSPITDSSHYIELIYDNDYKLDFYYSQENNWLIWSNVLDENEQKILEYHFLSPKESMEEWLSKVKPLATVSK